LFAATRFDRTKTPISPADSLCQAFAARREGGFIGLVTSPPPPGAAERLLVAARTGDETAFRRLIEPHRKAIHTLCYRMLGSPHDADDALQDSLLRAWRALPEFQGRSELHTWLHRIATNVCLDAMARRSKRVLPMDYGPAAQAGDAGPDEPLDSALWIAPYPDELADPGRENAGPETRYAQRETVELAFVAALQHLPPRQRGVFVLRDVLNFSGKEVAEMLETSTVSVASSLQRAREAIEQRLPQGSQQENLRKVGDARLRKLVGEIVEAFERGDVEAILAMLTEDATFSMPPYATWYQGRDQVADSWLVPKDQPTGLRFLPTRANGQLALGVYKLDEASNSYRPIALEVLSLRGELIAEVTAFRDPALIRLFALPEELPVEDG
jgi:RNA polymerase sigma-70 factor (ECF subfamily)